MQSIIHSIFNFLLDHGGHYIAAGIVAFLAGTVGLKKVISTRERAKWLEDGCHAVYAMFREKILASPNKWDDLALDFVEEMEKWAKAQGEELTAAEQARAADFARLTMAQKLASAVALAPAGVAKL